MSTLVRKLNLVVVLPTKAHPISPSLHGLTDFANYTVYGANHDFAADERFPDPTVTGLACMGTSPDCVDSLLKVHLPSVRWVHSFFAGVDSVLCQELKTRDDVVLTNAKGAFSESLAEFCLFGMMYFAKKLPTAQQLYRDRKYEKFVPRMLRGATLGIVGYGDIGEHVARLASVGFGMRVIALKRDPSSVSAKAREAVDEVRGSSDLLSVLPECDYVVAILPGTPQTHHLFGKEVFDAMKPTAVFLNIGRGSTCDSVALAAALRGGTIAGAVLDVQDGEPLTAESPLYDIGEERLLLTPHCADYTPCYWPSAARVFVERAAQRAKGQAFTDLVNKKLGY